MSQEIHDQSPPHPTPPPRREYERSGCYPENGRPFRIWALLGVLIVTIIMLAGISAVLNFLLL